MALNIGSLVGYLDLDASKFDDALGGAMDKLREFGPKGAKIAATAGAAIGLAIAGAVAGGMDLEAANDKLAAQLGATGPEAERIGGVAGNLYAGAWGDSLGQVNDAVGAVMTSIEGMSTATDAELEAVTAKALDFATAFEVDVTRAAQVAGQTVKTGLAGDATEAFDLMVAASQKVPSALREDLLDAVDEYGPMFAQLGLSGEQAFGLLVDASDKGMYGIDKAGDAVKEFTIRSTDMSSASKEAYDTIGLDAQTMANDILAGGDKAEAATGKIIDGLLAIKDPAAQGQAAIALFGTPLEDLGTDNIPGFLEALSGGTDAMAGFAGASTQMGDTLNDNAATNIESFKRQAQQAFVEILGGKALPFVNDFAAMLATNFGPALEVVSSALGTATGFLSEHATTANVLATVIAGVLIPILVTWGVRSIASGVMAVRGFVMSQAAAMKSAAVHVASAARTAAAWAVSMGQTLALHAMYAASAAATAAKAAAAWAASSARTIGALIAQGAAFVAQKTVMVAGAAVTGIMTAAQWALNAAMSANPLTLVIIAIVALVAAIVIAYQKSETFRNIVNAAWAAIKTGVKAVIDWLTEAVPKVFAWIKGAFLKYTPLGQVISHWGQIKAFIDGAISGIRAAIDWFKSLPGKFREWFGGVRDAVNGKISDVVNLVKGLPGRVLGVLGNIGSTLWQTGADLISGLIDGASSMLGRLGSFFLDAVPGWIRTPFKKALGISSPSRVMADLARWVPLGAIEGLKQTGPQLRQAMTDLVQPPDMPALTAPNVRLPARTLLDPNINRDAAAGYTATPSRVEHHRPVHIHGNVAMNDLDDLFEQADEAERVHNFGGGL